MRNINVGYKANYMKNNNKSVIVPMIIASTLGWTWFMSEAIKTNQLEDNNKNKPIIEDIKELSISEKIKTKHQYIYDEYERLKEEERKRLEELERQRLIKIEQERLAKIEAEKKRQREIEEAKKKKLQSSKGIVYNDNSGGWMTYQFTHFDSYCKEGCQGVTASGYDVSNTIYYDGMRILAADRSIPLYTIMLLEYPNGTQIKGIVLDRGGAIRGRLLDVLVNSNAEARKLGRQNGRVKVLRYGKEG